MLEKQIPTKESKEHLENINTFRKMLGGYAERSRIWSITGRHPFFACFDQEEYSDFYPWANDYGCIFRAWRPSKGFHGGEIIGGVIEVVMPYLEFKIDEYPVFKQRKKDLTPYHKDIKMLFQQHLTMLAMNSENPE